MVLLALILGITAVATPARAESDVLPRGGPVAERPESAARADVGVGRWRDLRVGMSAAEALATGKVERSEICSPLRLTRPWSRWAYLFFSDRKVNSIAIFGREERTATGAGRGTTLRRLRSQYADLSRLRHWGDVGDGIDYVFVRRQGRTITFQFRYGTDAGPGSHVAGMMVAGRRPQIFWEGC